MSIAESAQRFDRFRIMTNEIACLLKMSSDTLLTAGGGSDSPSSYPCRPRFLPRSAETRGEAGGALSWGLFWSSLQEGAAVKEPGWLLPTGLPSASIPCSLLCFSIMPSSCFQNALHVLHMKNRLVRERQLVREVTSI